MDINTAQQLELIETAEGFTTESAWIPRDPSILHQKEVPIFLSFAMQLHTVL